MIVKCPYCKIDVEITGHSNKRFCCYEHQLRYTYIKKIKETFRLNEHEQALLKEMDK